MDAAIMTKPYTHNHGHPSGSSVVRSGHETADSTARRNVHGVDHHRIIIETRGRGTDFSCRSATEVSEMNRAAAAFQSGRTKQDLRPYNLYSCCRQEGKREENSVTSVLRHGRRSLCLAGARRVHFPAVPVRTTNNERSRGTWHQRRYCSSVQRWSKL